MLGRDALLKLDARRGSAKLDHQEDIGLILTTDSGQQRDSDGKKLPKWKFEFETDKDHLTRFGLEENEAMNREKAKGEKYTHSVNSAKATLSFFGCCFYNCMCCCIPARYVGKFCGGEFFQPWCACFTIVLRRDRWLYMMHFVAFGVHLFMAIFTNIKAKGDMQIELTRVVSKWQNRGGEYKYEIVPLDPSEQFLYIDTVTTLFFALSATAHGMWVFLGPFERFSGILWKQLDNCLCWW